MQRVTTLAGHLSSHNTGQPTQPKVCLVIGAGAGIGATVGARFAREGFITVLCRRSNKEGLDKAVCAIEAEGGRAVGLIVNATEPGAIEDIVEQVERDIGPVHVAVYNLGAQIGGRSLAETSVKMFEMGWKMGTRGLFCLAKSVAPFMQKRGSGTIIVTSATAAVRGNAGQHSHAAAMGGRRMLCQTLNAELAKLGIHVCHVVVDGPVDAPDTLGKMIGNDAFDSLRASLGAQDGLILPSAVADTYFHLANQHRSAWTFECDLRPYCDTAWWNNG